MAINQKPRYYDALIAWCDAMCENTYILETYDGYVHCFDRGRQVDFQDDVTKRHCHKCPYGIDHMMIADAI